MKRESSPVYRRRIPLDEARRAKLSRFIRFRGWAPTAKLLRCSVFALQELESGGGCIAPTTEKVAAALDALEVAA